ncbi:organic solvent tolerance protein [Pseudomonas saudimassiliensis]|uniref:LPS-assembly protein LptD n=1 Tax=Pseudomonas saudimassiliensis TaxID=1461581 RepID=A0A078MBK8_9PSED|nr:LPS-assembly protein LptD [Pseudomonas saudimassiliensis]CEA03645.1 organic solvent tolerance protein [Pseudomonas saudimassiliensis]CEF26261.1 organic solvent tolerance protein [Pseudomonas saudimassiliensis]
MAYPTPPFRPSFSLLLVSGLLLAQPATSLAASQVECRADSSGGGWVCTPLKATADLPPRPGKPVVRAAEPEPEAERVVSDTRQPAARPRSADFSELDWVPRDQLTAAQQAAIAPYCSGDYIEPPRAGRNDNTPFDQLPVYASADSSSFEQRSQTGTLQGDVLLQQGRLQAQANQASFDQNNNLVRLEGDVRLRDQGVLVLGDRAQMQIDSGETRIEQVRYVVHDANARGSAEKLMRRDDAVIVMTDGSYTTCDPGRNTWALHSDDIELDQEKGWGEAKHVVLKVKDVPVFYTPYIYFPLDDRRHTGLLPPSLSNSTDNGTELVTPYYINIAPNYDATLYPRMMSKRGLQMEGEFRYMQPDHEGQLTASFLDDREFDDNRWLYGWEHLGGLQSRWTTEVEYFDISDPFFFQDLNSSLDARSDTYVNQRGAVTYRGNGWQFQAAVHAYELATITAVTPYERLPQLRLDGGHWLGDSGLKLDYRTEYAYFDRDFDRGFLVGEDGVHFDAFGPIWTPDENLVGLQRATGHRVSLSPRLSYPMQNSWGYFTPAARVQSTYYDLDFDDRQHRDPALAFDYDSADTNPSSTIPVASLDAGLYFDRDTSWFGRDLRQTLEPRAFYLYAPNRDQDDQPLFDTNENTFSYNALFRDDRFSGSDRVGDANQLALGVTSRALESNGVERARASFGQILYFEDQRVQLLETEGQRREENDNSSSAYAAEFMYRVSNAWKLRGDVLWDPQENNNNAGSLLVNYQPEPRKVINAGYRFRNETNTFNALTGTFNENENRRIDQSDMSFIWPLNPQWSMIGRWQHDFAGDRTLEAFGGLEYDSCCWKLRFINRYWVDYNEFESVTRDEGNRGIFLQVVLKGLGSVTGNRVDSLLDEGIPGYRERENNAF